MTEHENAYRKSVAVRLSGESTPSLDEARKINEQRLKEKRSVLKQALGNIVDQLSELDVDSWLESVGKQSSAQLSGINAQAHSSYLMKKAKK